MCGNGPVCSISSAAACPTRGDAEDILQDVFYELVEANRLLMPIDHVTGWLFRVRAQPHHRSVPQEVGRSLFSDVRRSAARTAN